jgi:hypothetical protein
MALKDSRFGFAAADSNSSLSRNFPNPGQRPQASQFNLPYPGQCPQASQSNINGGGGSNDSNDKENEYDNGNNGDDDNNDDDDNSDDSGNNEYDNGVGKIEYQNGGEKYYQHNLEYLTKNDIGK